MSGASPRLDKWLWHARFLKSRTLASKLCKSGKVRVNGELVKKAHVVVQPGDVLTFPLGPHIRLIKILKLSLRRGPAKEAQLLYEDLEPPVHSRPTAALDPVAKREPGAGRPTKSHRRAIDRLMGLFRGR